LQAFAQAVAADPALAGSIKIEVYGNNQLGDDLGMLANIVKGTLDGMLCSTALIGGVVPEIGIFNAPYVFAHAANARAALDGALGAEYTALAAAKGLVVLAWGENGMRQITSNKPVRTPADLHGLKIRMPQSEIMLAGMRAMGADPAPLAFGLLVAALRSGEFQAQENPIPVIEASKLYEVQKYLCLTGHIYDALGFLCCPDLMDDLTEPQRAALISCAKKGAAVTRQMAQDAQDNGVARLRANGMTVIDDVDIPAFQVAARAYLESLAPTYGADRIKRLIAAGA